MRLRLTALALALLAALLGSAGEQIRADAPPPPELHRAEPWLTLPEPPPRLTLTLRTSRTLCTAGTLTEVSWQISGGVPPYRLNVDDLAVDVSADNIRINCGALSEAEAADKEAALAAKRITATVTDSRGVRREAALEVARARALPAPSRPNATVQRTLIALHWSVDDEVRGTDGTARYLVRSRPTGQAVWNYVHNELLWSHDRTSAGIPGLSEGIAYEAQVAAVRDPLEALTPAALTWSGTTTATTTKAPSGVRATATHDTVTVVWDAQPSVRDYHIRIVERGSQGPGRLKWVDASPTVSREITFRGLDAATNYTVTVSVDGDFYSRAETNVDIATAQAPANWTPSERAPVIVGTRATHNMIEVSWAAPPTDARLMYLVSVEHPASPYPYADWVEGATTFSLDRLEPETTYTIHVHHHDLHGGKTTVEITTLPSPFAEPQSLIEWWADGRPTSPPLDLRLESSRELCTAGTLTEVSWQISGGVPPYRLNVDGSMVNPSAENVRINCGALTEAEAADAEAALAAKRITATVTDSRGVRREMALDVARARALPALADAGDIRPYSDALSLTWGGADVLHCGPAECFALRWRPVGEMAWTLEPFQAGNRQDGLHHYVGDLTGGVAYEAAAAAIRAPIEIETPDALNWTTAVQGTTLTAPTGLSTTATHDTITLRWNRQPSAKVYFVFLNGPDGGLRNHLTATDQDTWGHASSEFHEVVFRNLPSDTEFTAVVTAQGASEVGPGLRAEQTVRTGSAPAGHKALPRGPQNLRVTATATSITATWDEPFVGASSAYLAHLYHPDVESAWIEWIWAPELTVTFSGLQPNVTYRLVVEQRGPVANPVEVSVTTLDPSSDVTGAASDSISNSESHSPPPIPPTEPKPLIEWWVGGRPTSPPLHLKLESSRELCTAGTLTEVSWRISGGVPPYHLNVEDDAVGPSADNIRINCGALTEAEAADEEAALAAKRITAVVTDSRGVRREAALDVARVRALPPLAVSADIWPLPEGLGVEWPRVDVSRCDVGECFAIRWRAAGETAWTIEQFQPTVHIVDELHHYIGGLDRGATYEVAVAAIRDTIERETPGALRWTAPFSGTTLTAPTGLTATVTHDTVTLRWDRQPSAKFYYVFLDGGDGGLRNHLSALDRDTWGDASTAFHEVVFRNLPSDTEFKAIVTSHYRPEGGPAVQTTATIRTLPAPSGHDELPRGPQNLRATATATSITAMWDSPFSDAPSGYTVRLYHPASARPWVEGVWAPDLTVTFGGLPADTTYRLVVEQHGPVANSAEISVTTTTSSPAVEGTESGSISDPDPPPPPSWPPPYSFVRP